MINRWRPNMFHFKNLTEKYKWTMSKSITRLSPALMQCPLSVTCLCWYTVKPRFRWSSRRPTFKSLIKAAASSVLVDPGKRTCASGCAACAVLSLQTMCRWREITVISLIEMERKAFQLPATEEPDTICIYSPTACLVSLLRSRQNGGVHFKSVSHHWHPIISWRLHRLRLKHVNVLCVCQPSVEAFVVQELKTYLAFILRQNTISLYRRSRVQLYQIGGCNYYSDFHLFHLSYSKGDKFK